MTEERPDGGASTGEPTAGGTNAEDPTAGESASPAAGQGDTPTDAPDGTDPDATRADEGGDGPGESGGDAVATEGDGTEATGTTREAATVRSSTLRSTNHWVGIAGVTFVTAGMGVAVRSRALFLAAVVGVGYLAYASATEPSEPSLAVTRSLEDTDPDPGDRVRVTVTVENTGDALVPDLRLVDQVPPALAVVDGSARTATALRPGASVTFAYTVLARRGEHTFDGVDALVRNASGSRERELDVATGATAMTCMPPVDATEAVPLRGLTSPYTGRVSTDTAGEGVEFASMREYQTGDPPNRIDWNRYARDGALATMEFREERMATVVVLLELRREAYLQGDDDEPHAVDRGIDATRRLFNSLLATGDRVGIAALSAADVWLAPGAGPTHQARARHLLTTHPALSPTPPEDSVYVPRELRRLVQRLEDDAQVVFVSPVPDETSVYAARWLQVRGHPVTVVSPDPTLTDTPGRTLASVARSNRLHDLRQGGVRVVDWASGESLATALERARGRWSA